MKNLLCLVVAFAVSLLMIGGCGGTDGINTLTGQSSPFNGLYRTSFTRGTSAVTVYLNFPNVEVVVTDEANGLPSYVGSSTTGATSAAGVVSFAALPLVASDGETALASGTFGTVTGATGGQVTLTITGGVGFSGQIPLSTTATNTLFVGTYTGSYTSTFVANGATTVEPAGAVTSLTLAADSRTGGYDLNGSGATTDPLGNPVNFTIKSGQVDPAGIISNYVIVYSYANGTTPSVTNTFTTAYLNLGVVATTTLVGFQTATTTNWPNGAIESDNLLLNQTSTVVAKARH